MFDNPLNLKQIQQYHFQGHKLSQKGFYTTIRLSIQYNSLNHKAQLNFRETKSIEDQIINPFNFKGLDKWRMTHYLPPSIVVSCRIQAPVNLVRHFPEQNPGRLQLRCKKKTIEVRLKKKIIHSIVPLFLNLDREFHEKFSGAERDYVNLPRFYHRNAYN